MLAVVFFIAVCTFSVRLMRFQITDGASYRKQANKATVASISIAAPRGEILDRYGNVLATNNVSYSMILEYTTFSSSKTGDMNSKIIKLTSIMSACNQQWIDTLPVNDSAPYAFVSKTSGDIATFRKQLVQLKLITAGEKDTVTADKAVELLKKRYKVASGYTQQQARTIVGVRYSMETEGFMQTAPYTFANNVGIDCVNRVMERSIPGIEVSESYSRTYPDGTIAPHVIGNVGKMSDAQIKKYKSKGYSLNEYIGQSGLESVMQDQLRGTNGTETITINSTGTITGKEVTTAAKPGNNIVTTLDANLQRVLQQSLADTIAQVRSDANGDIKLGSQCKAGAAVVENIKTGEILAMATCPTYDNNTFYSNYNAILNTPGSPLNNRAVMAYRPGSSYKPCVAVSALMNNVVTKNDTIDCNGSYMKYAPSYVGKDDDVYGFISIVEAIGKSSNVFFDTLGDRLNLKNETLLEQTAKALGLGQPTGVELHESTGVISGPTEKKARGDGWYPADAVQSAIGQLDNLYTPLQLANYIGTICNGGKRMDLHVVKEVKSYDNTKTISSKNAKVASDLKIPSDVVDTVKEGMLHVTEGDGTAGVAFADYSLPVGGKTGTAQVHYTVDGVGVEGYGGVFVCFAPYKDPQIAIAVSIENCQWGAQAAPVAKSALNYLYMNNPDFSSPTLPTSSTGTLIK